jgi:hypothetical protein
MRDTITLLKVQRGCSLCGEKRAPALEWHHRSPHRKEISISDAISQDWNFNRILAEIAKCDVICKNCHSCQHSIYDEGGKRRRRRRVPKKKPVTA